MKKISYDFNENKLNIIEINENFIDGLVLLGTDESYIYCKNDENINTYKEKLINHLISETKCEIDSLEDELNTQENLLSILKAL